MSLNNDSHSALALAADGLLPQAIDSAPPPGKSDLLPVLPSNANLATPSEQWFDDLALLACEICHTPMAFVSLVVAEPHWFKSRAGAEIAKAVHAVAFCSGGLPQRDVLIIPDAALDERFASHPLITGSPGIRFIAGVPLVTTEGHGLGTFYVIDQVAQQLTTAQLAALRALGRQAVTQLELRRCLLDQEELSPAAKRVSPTLRENEAPENAILESVSDCIVTFNQEGNLIGFNPAAERTFGYPRAAVLGKNILTLFVSPTGYERPPQELARCLRAGTGSAMNQRIELTALHSDGTVFPVEFSFIRVGLAEPAQYTGLIRDISDRKCLLAALQAERDLLTVTLNCIPDAIIAVDTAGRVQLLGGKAEQLTGWKAASAIGRPLTEVFELLDGGGGLVVDLMAEVQRHGRPVGNIHSLEQTHVQKSAAGNHRMIALCALPLCQPADKVHGALVVFREVTAELEAARLRQDFMHMASHELRTPLTAIRGFIDTIQADPAMPVPTIRSFLTIVHEQAQRLHHLLNDILEVSRIEAGNLQYEEQPLQLGDLVARTLAQLAPSAALRQLLVESTVAADLPEFRGDAERLQSVMTNLLSNAIKFTPDGGKIALELGTENGHFRFAVRDTGVGIALEHQKRVFDKFYRVIRTGQQVPGSGLGLTKVRAVVEHYGGRVQVESKVGQGSCFTVFLPLTTVRQAQAQRTGFG